MRCRGQRGCFFFNDTATTEIYTLSLHDALPISVGGGGRADLLLRGLRGAGQRGQARRGGAGRGRRARGRRRAARPGGDRESTRLNSSHANISYAGFFLKKTQTPRS